MPNPKRATQMLLLLVLRGMLAACGFQLRGSYGLPFKTMSIALAPSSALYAQIKRGIEASTATRVVDDPKEAEANLIVLGDRQEKVILSLNAAGRAREYDLVRTFTFKVTAADSTELLPPSRITLRRDMTFNDDQVLSKESEEALLWRDMQSDLIQQVLRRLSSIHLVHNAAEGAAHAATP
jgi:LPS-assembly lipoprotein